jgi:hypothetical protein
MDKLLEKLKAVGMQDADLLEFQEAYNKKLEEQVSLRVDEEKKKLELATEEASKKAISEAIEAEKAKLVSEFDTKVVDLEKNLVEQLDSFLEAEVNDKISEDLIEKSAINEALLPIVESIKKIFEEQYVALDTEGAGLLKTKETELTKRTKELSESIAKNMSFVEQVDTLNKKVVLMEKTANLSENQKKRVNDLFEGKDSKFTSDKIDSFIQMITEDSNKSKEKTNLNENTDAITSDGDKITPEVKSVNKVDKAAPSILNKAADYL